MSVVKQMGRWSAVLAFVFVLTGCSVSHEFNNRFHRPIRIRVPNEGTALKVGQPFNVVADITVDYPVTAVEVGLWGITADDWHTWLVTDVELGRTIHIDETFEMPKTLRQGGEYQLSVTAVRGDTRGVATRDSLPVKLFP